MERTQNAPEMGADRTQNGADLGAFTRIRVDGIPSDWKDLLEQRAAELTISTAGLVRMILGDWMKEERRRRKGEGRP